MCTLGLGMSLNVMLYMNGCKRRIGEGGYFITHAKAKREREKLTLDRKGRRGEGENGTLSLWLLYGISRVS